MEPGMPNNDRPFASVFYDAECQFCVDAARRFERVLARRRFELVPLQVPGASAEFGVPTINSSPRCGCGCATEGCSAARRPLWRLPAASGGRGRFGR